MEFVFLGEECLEMGKNASRKEQIIRISFLLFLLFINHHYYLLIHRIHRIVEMGEKHKLHLNFLKLQRWK